MLFLSHSNNEYSVTFYPEKGHAHTLLDQQELHCHCCALIEMWCLEPLIWLGDYLLCRFLDCQYTNITHMNQFTPPWHVQWWFCNTYLGENLGPGSWSWGWATSVSQVSWSRSPSTSWTGLMVYWRLVPSRLSNTTPIHTDKKHVQNTHSFQGIQETVTVGPLSRLCKPFFKYYDVAKYASMPGWHLYLL